MHVSSVRYEQMTKTYRLENGKQFVAHRYCCLGPGDELIVSATKAAHAKCRNGKAQILPPYEASDSIQVGSRTLKLVIKEVESEEELLGYHQLEAYHYRGKVLHGRRVPLIVRSDDPLLPLVLGYIELSTAFIMNRPRALLLDSPYRSEGKGDIKWQSWKKDTVRRLTNLIVRIARTVVSPEFRGLGLARLLVNHAARFARDHWHVGGLKPLFLEITADMLRYVPFVESAGMHYIGDTEGNLARVNEDMTYILKNMERVKNGEILREDTGGIVDLQVSYATSLKQIEETESLSRDQLLRLLLRSPERLSDDNWALLHRIFRLPKPTFLMGLSPDSETFVKQRVEALGLPALYPVEHPPRQKPTLGSAIDIRNCSLSLTSALMRTSATRKIQQAFGVSRDMLRTTLFANLSFSINPGDIVLICGPSGAGKTTLLSLLTGCLLDPSTCPSGENGQVSVPRSAVVSSLGALSSARPLINSLGKVSFEHALFALNVSGLAEPHLYVKRYRELSNGQRYRAMVAKLIASPADVWIADEYCATLDPITANIVSRNLSRSAKRRGVTVILAAANWTEFIHELCPDTVVHLRAPWDCRVFAWGEFQQSVHESCALGLPGLTGANRQLPTGHKSRR